MHEIRRSYNEIKNKWLKYAPRQWWGDSVDVRFYTVQRVKNNIKTNFKILDIGCNAGIILSELKNATLRVGVDSSFDYLAKAVKLSEDIILINGRAEALPFKDSYFDIVTANHVLPYVEDGLKGVFIREAMRVLKSGGLFFISTWNRNYMRYKNDKIATRFEDLVRLFKDNLPDDLKYKIKGYNPLPPFPMFLPNILLSRIPGIWHLLDFLSRKDILKDHCVSFFAEIRKG